MANPLCCYVVMSVGEGSEGAQWRLLCFPSLPSLSTGRLWLFRYWFLGGWVCVHSRTLWVSPNNSLVWLGVFLERMEGREKERERNIKVWLPVHGPYWGPGPQPRHVPWLAIKPATLWFAAHTQFTELHQPGPKCLLQLVEMSGSMLFMLYSNSDLISM